MIGQTLSHYEIESCLGEGGSGVVYRGRDLRLDRQVAIKVLADDLRDDELAWARLLREARLASQMNHPHIAAIYDLGEEDGRAYIVMEYVEGLPLSDLIPEGGMPLEQVERYAAQIAGALEYAHQQGVIHGDLKGTNILVTSDGNIKLVDFGLGRRIPRNGMAEVTSSHLPLAEVGATAGTLPYLAPEVLRGNPTSLQSDVWAWGVLLYQMATGELPFRGATPFELCMEIMVSTPAKLHQLPEPLQSTVRLCLEKDSKTRRSLVGDLAGGLTGIAQGTKPTVPVPEAAAAVTTGTELAVPSPVPKRRGRWWALGAATGILLLLLGGVYVLHHRALPPQIPQPIPDSKALKTSNVGNPGAKVWVNTDSGTYHCPGTRWYGKTQAGEYMTQKDAQDKGYHPAARHVCM